MVVFFLAINYLNPFYYGVILFVFERNFRRILQIISILTPNFSFQGLFFVKICAY